LRAIHSVDAHEEAESEFLTIKRKDGEALPSIVPLSFGEWAYDNYELEHENIMFGTGEQKFLAKSLAANDKVNTICY
jgi:hypothetical protein